jgi:gliding motility-associated-like protein
MKNLFVSLICLATFQSAFSQITINNTLYTTNQLVNGVLVPVSSGVTVSNVTFSGVYNNSSRYQVGYFSTATTTLAQMGFTSGIVLTTGNTSDIPLTLGQNPQAAAQMSTGYVSCTPGEVRETSTCPTVINDLNVLAGVTNYFNAAILEFDFVPVGDIAQFRYIFGSEEFTDNSGLINYQCSSYNDKFGFLISGPGIAGGQGFTNNARNIARLANGSQVSINAVNNGTVGSSGGAPSAANCQAANPAWVQNTATSEYLGTIDGTELNGNTIILTASQTGLTPGQTYHIKLIVTDVGDAAYDAVVYLEAGSFTTTACSNPTPPTIGTITQPSCTTTNGSVALGGLPSTGTWTVTATPGGGTITGTGTTGNFTGLIPNTTYTFTVTNAAGCTSISSANCVVNAIPANPTAPVIGTITQPTCALTTGSVALSGLPSSGSWTVTASPGGATITGSGTTGNFSGLSANTTYTFTVTNASGCTSVASANAVINAIPTNPTAPVIGAITQPSCLTPTGSVALSGLPASGTWTVTAAPGGATQTGTGTSTSFTGLTSNTTYTFTMTNSSSCTSLPSANAVISLYTPSPPVVGTITQPTCSVATGTVALSGLPSTGAWTVTATPGGATLNSSGTTGTFTGLAAGGSYTFIVTDNSGCLSSASTSAVINAQPVTPSAPVLGAITQPTCLTNTGSVALSGLPASGTWTISTTPGGTSTGTGTTTTIASLTASSSYTFTVTNSAGCTSSATANAVINAVPTAPTAPVVGTVTQPSCLSPTGSVDLSGLPAGNWTITSSPGGLTQSGTTATTTFTGLSSNTTYTFTVTNTTTLCTSPASGNAVISLYTPTAPIVGTITQPTCLVATGSVALSGLPSSGAWTVTSSPGGATLNNSGTTANFTGLTSGSYTFTVTDNSGCVSVASTAALINAQPVTPSAPAIGTITQPTCLNNTGSIELTGLPTGNWTINASSGGATNGSGSTYTYVGLPASSSYSYTVTNSQGCTSLASITANVNAVPLAPSSPVIGTISQPTCAEPGGSVVLTGLPSTGTWVVTATPGGTTTTGTGTTTTITDLSAGTTFTFVVTDAGSCSSLSSAAVVIDPLPNAPNAPAASVTVQPTCTTQTGTVTVTAPLGVNYAYSIDGTNYQASPNFSGLAPGIYDVSVQDILTSCTSTTTSLTVNAVPSGPAAPVVNITAQPTCAVLTGSVEIVSPIGANYEYTMDLNGSLITLSSTTVSGLTAAQTYSFTVTDNTTGCVSTSFDVSIDGVPTPETVDAGPDYTINAGETVTLTASGNGTMIWNTGDTTSTSVSPTTITTYVVTLTDSNGCVATDEATVFLTIDCGELFIPTAFSPNTDAVNNTFGVKINADCVKEMDLKVYDRWGEVVFETQNPTTTWDGKYKGKDLDSAVFVYVLEITLNTDTESQKFKGNLSLIK